MFSIKFWRSCHFGVLSALWLSERCGRMFSSFSLQKFAPEIKIIWLNVFFAADLLTRHLVLQMVLRQFKRGCLNAHLPFFFCYYNFGSSFGFIFLFLFFAKPTCHFCRTRNICQLLVCMVPNLVDNSFLGPLGATVLQK